MRRIRTVLMLAAAMNCAAAARLSAQTAPTIYGAPQTVYGTLGSPNPMTLSLPMGNQPVPADTIYIIQTALRGQNSDFATPSGFGDFCTALTAARQAVCR